MGSSQVPALARKAWDQVSTTGSMTILLPSHRSRTRVPRGRRQSPTKRTARLLPTLKTTVSPFTRRRISCRDIHSSFVIEWGLLIPRQPASVEESVQIQGGEAPNVLTLTGNPRSCLSSGNAPGDWAPIAREGPRPRGASLRPFPALPPVSDGQRHYGPTAAVTAPLLTRATSR